jgi:hypothetical protein
MRRRQLGLVLPASIALLVVPIVLDLLVSGPRRLFALVAPDTFYYLVVGRNAGLHGSISYDGEHWSNGFHPLWQAVVAALYALRLPGTGTHWDLAYLVVIGLGLLVGSLYALGRVYRRADGSLNPLFVLMPVGAYALLVCGFWLQVPFAQRAAENPWEGADPLYGTLWRDVNGMETSAVVAAFCWLLTAYVEPRWERGGASAAKLGIALATLGLARLDHLCFSLVLWAFCGVRAARSRAGRARSAWVLSSAVFFGVIGVYLVSNRLLFGTAVPISGRMKSSWPIPNLENATLFVDFYGWLLGGRRPPFFLIWRALQSVVPPLAATLAPLALLSFRARPGGLDVRWAGPKPRLSQALAAAALGIFILHTYDFFFVPPSAQGNWYYPVSILFVSLLALQAAERGRRLLPFRHVPLEPRLSRWGELAVCAAAATFGVWFCLRFQYPKGYHRRYVDFYFEEAPRVRRRFRDAPPKLLELDDGIVSYATGFPAMSATGLVLDLEAARAAQSGWLVELALSRGFDHVTSLVGVDFSSIGPQTSPAALRGFISRIGAGIGRAAEHPLTLVYRSPPPSWFTIIEIEHSSAASSQ